MGSNVINLAGAQAFNALAPSSGTSVSTSASISALSVPSFRRRPASSRTQLVSTGEHWAAAARRRVALRLIESTSVGSTGVGSTGVGSSEAPTLQPLRVMRLVEAGQAPGTAGRLRLSGRLADVCAELDRMAEAEPFNTHARRA
ncbi:hypothetical protein [Ottowia thiooxydans]|uniref:hypothetical protein n=1 Tax=Ottowia thiooxydans TaxID=219182 RepID=UPI00055A4B4B|nr:hypothetical protein [Ottowia thiooxydans]